MDTGWHHEPELLVRIDLVPDEALRRAHAAAKSALTARVQSVTGLKLRPELPIVAFARRMPAYKRPDGLGGG